jgi:predicted ArsR family transcriptional regulator
VTVPPREYELVAHLLAVAVEGDSAGRSRTALDHAARHYGASLATHSRPGVSAGQAVQTALADHGFEPWRDEDGTIRLRNCPFHQLAAAHTDLVCGMNLALISGLIDGLGAPSMHAELNPGPGRCCVAITADDPPADSAPADTTTAETTTGWS